MDDRRNARAHDRPAETEDARRTAGQPTPGKGAENVFDNALQRTDNRFAGKADDKSLIGEDIPDEVQDAEEREEEGWPDD